MRVMMVVPLIVRLCPPPHREGESMAMVVGAVSIVIVPMSGMQRMMSVMFGEMVRMSLGVGMMMPVAVIVQQRSGPGRQPPAGQEHRYRFANAVHGCKRDR